MRITDLKLTPVFVPIEAPLVYSQGAHPGVSRILVELETDEGLVGLGECYGGKAREGQLEEYREALIGEDPFALERIRWRFGSPSANKLFGTTLAFAAIEFACLDLQGKALGKPVAELIGGRVRDHVQTSAYLFYRYANADGEGEISDAERLIAHARELIDRHGFGTIKFKNGVRDVEEEIETTLALREAFPRHRLRIDPNAVWTVSTAIQVARRLSDCGLEYLEDPTWGVRGLARVNAKAPWVTLASNMSVFEFDDLMPAVAENAVDVVLLDPHWYGGLSRARLAGQVCETFNVDVGMHSGAELGVSMAAMLHLGAVLPNLTMAIDSHYHHLLDDIVVEPLRYERGGMAVPTAPGLGVELDPDKVARYAELARTQEMGSWIDDPRRDEQVVYLPKW